MKITNEQLRALQEAESRRTRTARAGDEFGALFTRQLDAGQSQAAATSEGAAALAPGLRSVPLAGLMEQPALSGAQTDAQEAAGRMETMFGSLERYAGELARDNGADLRRAYGMLEDMSKQIAGFKARFPDASAEQPEMAALVTEFDVLVTAETFKFNRGDYIG